MTRPNLLVLMSDEHQARAMSHLGHFAQTPNLDTLAARGMRFSNAYTPSPICVPARAAFATGRYVHDIGLWDNAMPYAGQVPGWGHALQTAGVPVESIGKLHYRQAGDPAGFDREHLPMHVVGGHGMVWASIRREEERRPDTGPGRMLGPEIGAGTSAYTDYDQAVTDRDVEWLAEAPDGPWCLYVGLVAPHFPLVVPQRFLDLYPLSGLPEAKLHPRDGHDRHPWVDKQDAFSTNEGKFRDEEERLTAMAAYYGLISWMDHNVGRVLDALSRNGLSEDTVVVYTSDHGDNAGARGLWGKSNMYEESAAIPMLMAGPGVRRGTCETPVSLLDLSESILHQFDAPLAGDRPGRPLQQIAEEPHDTERTVFSEYHAAGAVSGAFMVRWDAWKFIHYDGFAPELFHLETDPEETENLAPARPDMVAEGMRRLHRICDPGAVNARAFADQDAMIAAYGGRDAAMALGAPGATPPPKTG